MDAAAPGRARGRSRGRGRPEDLAGPEVRRPGETENTAGVNPLGRTNVQPTAPFQQPPMAGSTGRATSATRERPDESRTSGPGTAAGRASVSYRGAVQPPETEPASQVRGLTAGLQGIEIVRASAGRGASRGREVRDTVIVTRPSQEFSKQGSSGDIIQLGANYFELLSRPDMHLLQYRVDFAPEIDHIGVRKALVRNHEATLGKYLFDGTLLYNVTRLSEPYEVFSKRASDGSDVRISFRLVGEVQKNDAMYTAIMNIIVRRCLGMLKLVQVKRDYFDCNAAQEIPQHQLTVWPGYLTTIRHHENGYLLGVEIIHKVLRRDTALDVMTKLRQTPGDIEGNAKAALLGQVIMTRYNNKTYRIDDIDFNMKPTSTFHLRKEDSEISYIDYYSKRYGVNITNRTQPLLVSRPSRRDVNRGENQPIYLIPELCTMTGLSEDQRTNFNLMKEVGNITRVPPDRRVESLMRFKKRMQDQPEIQRELNSWGLQFSDQIVWFDGRVIPPSKVIQGNNAYPPDDGDWSRKLHNNAMAVTAKMTQWAVILPSAMSNEVRGFVEELKKVGSRQNFMIPDPSVVILPADRTNNYLEAMDNESNRKEHNMIMCVMRSSRKDTYSAIKRKAYVQMGVPSQVITGRILRGPPSKITSIATKVMIQIASKLGAEPWQMSLPRKNWMVVGYDTYHDARQRKAVGALVASINQSFTRYFSSVKIHENNEEISPSFTDHVLDALKSFYIHNHELPEKIFFYRDGVGAGDIARLKETEIAAIRKAFDLAGKKLNLSYQPGISFVVVSKRINARFFAMRNSVITNPPCGTVIDSTVTFSERYDFFLVSQKVTQGTVSPTSYHVIEDNSDVRPDIQQRLAYGLTHLYYNWPGTLRVPAPIQYAHKLAYMVGESIMGTPHQNLSNLLYYL